MIHVDISNIWGELSLPDLLSIETELSAAHMTVTERSGAGNEFLGWLELPDRAPTAEHMRILAAAHRIRETSDVLVVIGIGGSYLGPRAAIELLQGAHRNIGKGKGDPMILFAGNHLSTRAWNEMLKLLEGKDYSLCVISKSGTTLEPAVAFRNLRWMLERRYGTAQAKRRIYAITDKGKGALRQMADEEGWESFVIPGDVGGRFSVLSPVGLLPMAAAGIDIMALLKGAAEAIWQFNVGLIDALCDIVPAVKPQAAYYENLGWQGMEMLERTIAYAKKKGMFVIADIKRGDIGSTATAYAEGWLSGAPIEGQLFKSFDADCVTLNGYMGSDSIKPFLKAAKEEDSVYADYYEYAEPVPKVRPRSVDLASRMFPTVSGTQMPSAGRRPSVWLWATVTVPSCRISP